MPHDARLKATKAEIARVLEALKNAGCLDDEELKLDSLEGETQITELVTRLVRDCEEDETTVEAIKLQIANRNERKARLEARVEARRQAIVELLQCAGLTKLTLPEATVSKRDLAPRLKVVDADKLPIGFFTVVRKPDAEAIKALFEEKGDVLPGTVKTNGGVSLTIRRK